MNCQAMGLSFSSPFGIPKQVLAIFGDGDVGMHAASIHADDRLGQKAGGDTQSCGNLATDELIKLDLIGRSHYVANSCN